MTRLNDDEDLVGHTFFMRTCAWSSFPTKVSFWSHCCESRIWVFLINSQEFTQTSLLQWLLLVLQFSSSGWSCFTSDHTFLLWINFCEYFWIWGFRFTLSVLGFGFSLMGFMFILVFCAQRIMLSCGNLMWYSFKFNFSTFVEIITNVFIYMATYRCFIYQ